jgi:hypothetical protein
VLIARKLLASQPYGQLSSGTHFQTSLTGAREGSRIEGKQAEIRVP